MYIQKEVLPSSTVKYCLVLQTGHTESPGGMDEVVMVVLVVTVGLVPAVAIVQAVVVVVVAVVAVVVRVAEPKTHILHGQQLVPSCWTSCGLSPS